MESKDHSNPYIIPFYDLRIINKGLRRKYQKGIKKLFKNSNFILGNRLELFESKFASMNQVTHAVGVASGTDALEILLRANGIKVGDEVILPTNSFLATAIAVKRIGAKPVFIDCDENFLINLENIRQNINRNTKAIISVSLFGQAPNLEAINKICSSNGLYHILDNAQAIGSLQRGKPLSTYCDSATSFYPTKNLGAVGDGGAVLSSSIKIRDICRLIRNYGGKNYEDMEIFGFNSRLDEIQAIYLLNRMPKIQQEIEAKRKVVEIYINEFQELNKKVILPRELDFNYHSWHLFVIRVNSNKQIIELAKRNGIQLKIHYPTPLHLISVLNQNKLQSLSMAEKFSKQIISLPLYPSIPLKNVRQIVNFFKNNVKELDTIDP